MARVETPALVIDLGSGTGLATRYWADKARRVIGIEPAADMRRQAEVLTTAKNVSYREGFSHQTHQPARCAQIVSCSQALHWMEPAATFQEAARILQPGGVFAANDYDWPPATGAWEADAAFAACMSRIRRLEEARKVSAGLRQWSKSGHLARMRASGRFRHVKEAVLHHVDRGNTERLVGLLLSQGSTMGLLKLGLSEAELGIDVFREIAQRTLGTGMSPWYWSARIRIGVV